MPRKAKRKSESDKSNSKTTAEDNGLVKRKAVEKKVRQAYESCVQENSSLQHFTSSGTVLEKFNSKSAVPKYVSKFDIPEYDKKHKPAASGSISKNILPKNVLKGTIYKSSLEDVISKYEPQKAFKGTADVFMETESQRIPKVKITKIIPRNGSETKSKVEKFKVETIPPENTTIRKKNTISNSNLQTHVPNSDPELKVTNNVNLNNLKDFFAVPKLPLHVEALKSCNQRNTSNSKKGRPKKKLRKLLKKPQKGKWAKSTFSTKPLGSKINKKSVTKTNKSNVPKVHISKSIYPQRAAAIAAEVKLTALQAPHSAKKKAKKPGPRGRALVHKPMGFKTFKRIMTTVHKGVKPVIQQFLQQFCNHNFLYGGYKRYTQYKRLQYELEGLYGSLLKIIRHLSKVLHHVEGRYKNQLKKLNLYVPQKRKPIERKGNWTYPAKPSKKFKGERPVLEKKPHERFRRNRAKPQMLEDPEEYEFWCFMEHFIGDIVPLMKYKQTIRRDIRKTRYISNEENYEELKQMESAVPEDKYLLVPYKNNIKEISCAGSNLKKHNNENHKEIAAREKLCKLTSMLNSLKSLSDKNSLWLQTLFKRVEVEIERQHVKKKLSCNDEIVAQICDELLEILWYERDLKENQRTKVLEYINTRRTYLWDLNKFCRDKCKLLPESNKHHRCMSSMCVECSVTERPHHSRLILL